MTPPLVSIVSICWNRKADIRESLRRIQDIDYPNLEIIVADNASTDGTPAMIESDFPEVHLLQMPRTSALPPIMPVLKSREGNI